MTFKIQIREEHLNSTRLEKALKRSEDLGYVIGDDVAVTIAAMFQSPGTIGAHFAAFASGCEVTTHLLWVDLQASTVTLPRDDTENRRYLTAFRAWLTEKEATIVEGNLFPRGMTQLKRILGEYDEVIADYDAFTAEHGPGEELDNGNASDAEERQDTLDGFTTREAELMGELVALLRGEPHPDL